MRFDDRFLDEVKSRLRLSDVIGRTVKLRRSGREFVGLSPFNKEKSPSFYVNDEKGFYHDFSSGKHGDLVDWLRETGGLSFREAVETLAGEAGVPLPVSDARDVEREKVRQGLQDWLEEAAKWFERQLRRPPAAEARAYLERRGLPEAEWPSFRLGYAPGERGALRDVMVQKGAKPSELVEAGLLIAPEGGGQPYDRFRDRIIFPITDPRGRVISFGGRALNPDDRAKYLNGPDSPLFHKGVTLYGLQEARRILTAPSKDKTEPDPPLVVVEGYMDAIACQRVGVAAVAPLGTALTEEQMALLWRSHPEPTLCFDGDDAGRRAAWKTLDRALPLLQPGRSFQFALLTDAKDPDELLRESGPAALKTALADTNPFVAVLFERERAGAEPLDTPERRAGLKAGLRKLAAGIADKDLSAAYRDELLARFDQLWRLERPAETLGQAGRALAQARWTGRRRAPLLSASEEGKRAAARLDRSMRPLTAAVAQAIVLHPDLIDDHLEVFATQGFRDEALRPLASELVNLRLAGLDIGGEVARSRLEDAGLSELLTKIAEAAAKYRAPFLDPAASEETVRALWSQAFDVLVRLDALERAVDAAKLDLEQDADASAFLRLKAERDALNRAAASGEVFDPPLA